VTDDNITQLASIAANQANTTKALEALASEVAAARREGQANTLELHKRLGAIDMNHAKSAAIMEQHIKLADERHEIIWRIFKWVAGLVVGGGTVLGGSKLAEAARLF